MHTLYFCCLAVLFHLNTLNQEMNQKQCCFRFLFTHWNIIRQYMLSDNTAAEYLGLEATVRFCTFITKFFIYFCNKHFFAKGFRFLLIRESEFVTVKSVHHWVFTFDSAAICLHMYIFQNFVFIFLFNIRTLLEVIKLKRIRSKSKSQDLSNYISLLLLWKH